MPEQVLNVDFLRSGAQFAAAPVAPPNVAFLRPASSRLIGRGSRATDRPSGTASGATVVPRVATRERHHELCVKKAIAEAAANRVAPVQPRTAVPADCIDGIGINVGFLRSGRQFVADGAGLARCGRAAPMTRPKIRKNERLEMFYRSGLQPASAEPAAERSLARRNSASGTGVNVAFLRSGKQFVVRGDGAARPSERPAALSANARLNEFYLRTVAAARSAAESLKPATINVGFLRSGAQFKPVESSKPTAKPRTTRGERLAKFHESSLAAAASAVALG